MPPMPELGGGIALNRTRGVASIYDLPSVLTVSSGRAAFYLALKEHGVSAGDEVLVPAYHCPSFIEPAEFIGATLIFYDITETLDIDISDIHKKISTNSKAILIPHFFNVRQNIKKLKEQCGLTKQVAIIEDCAHAFFIDYNDVSEDMKGDYVIGSLTKFFPVYDGGVLASKNKLCIKLEKLTLKQELRSIYNLLHMAVRYNRLRWLSPVFKLIDALRPVRPEDIEEPLDLKAAPFEKHINDLEYLEPELLDKRASKITRYIISHSDFDAIANKRRENYCYIVEQLKSEPNIDLSLNRQELNSVPYMVLVRLKDPLNQHASLKELRLPVWRWDRLYVSKCKQAHMAACSIIQIPCHQQLRKDELSALVVGLKECLREG